MIIVPYKIIHFKWSLNHVQAGTHTLFILWTQADPGVVYVERSGEGWRLLWKSWTKMDQDMSKQFTPEKQQDGLILSEGPILGMGWLPEKPLANRCFGYWNHLCSPFIPYYDLCFYSGMLRDDSQGIKFAYLFIIWIHPFLSTVKSPPISTRFWRFALNSADKRPLLSVLSKNQAQNNCHRRKNIWLVVWNNVYSIQFILHPAVLILIDFEWTTRLVAYCCIDTFMLRNVGFTLLVRYSLKCHDVYPRVYHVL